MWCLLGSNAVGNENFELNNKIRYCFYCLGADLFNVYEKKLRNGQIVDNSNQK